MSMLPFRAVPEVLRFLLTYDTFGGSACPVLRKKLCVLYGPSGCGKTSYVRSLIGTESLFVVECFGLESVTLAGFDHNVHRCILWDEASVSMVLRHRRVFQHPPYMVNVGHSPITQQLLSYWLNEAVSIVCSSTWFDDLDELGPEERQWIEDNTMMVHVHRHLAMLPLGRH